MFVSREIRERKGNSSSFWTSKWVHLKDGKNTISYCCVSCFCAMFVSTVAYKVKDALHVIPFCSGPDLPSSNIHSNV